MATICPKCRKPPTHPQLVTCEDCKEPFVDETKIPIYLNSNDIWSIANSILHRPLFWIVFAIGIIASVLTVVTLFEMATGKRIDGYMDKVANTASNYVTEVYAKLTNDIASKLNTPRINVIIEDVVKVQSEKRIDITADTIISKKIKSEINPRLKAADEKLQLLDETIKQAKATVADLKQQSEFITILLAAQNDDRHAYDRLDVIANDNTNAMSKLARQAWVKIRLNYAGSEIKAILAINWPSGFDPNNNTMDVLTNFYMNQNTLFHAAGVQQIWSQTNITKKVRMQFLIDVMKSDASLNAVDYARKFFWKTTDLSTYDLEAKPLLCDPLYQWWEKNKDSIKD